MTLATVLLLEWLIGDPVNRWHPVAWFGRWAAWCESFLYSDECRRGMNCWLFVIALPLALLWIMHVVIGWPFDVVLLWVSIGWKSLFTHVRAVLGADSLSEARKQVGLIVSRDTNEMNMADTRRAALESLAENASDAVVAPLFWFLLAGPLGAALYRMINTLDAMWGYHNIRYECFGWCAARTDDLANWLPARITARLMLWVGRATSWHEVKAQAQTHVSPNAGWPEVALSFAAGVQLGGSVVRGGIVDERPCYGSEQARLPDDSAAFEALTVVRDTLLLAAVFALGVSIASDYITRQRLLVDEPKSFPHGGNVEAVAGSWGCEVSDVLDLSTGLHPEGPPTWLNDWMYEHAELAGCYPDRNGEPARSALAEAFDLSPENILITAGAQAVIEVIFQAMAWQSMAIQVPCYNEPIRCARRAGCDVLAFESETAPVADMLWLTSPSNPSGQVTWPRPDAPSLTTKRFTICLDESYMSFSQRQRLGLIPDVIRIGSLTKSFCIPGLRLGYVVARCGQIAQLQQWLPPWPASTLAQHLLPELVLEADARDRTIEHARLRLVELLHRNQWQVEPSRASFVMAFPNGAMPDFASHRIMVRQFPEWPQLDGWVRFGLPGNETDWRRLEEALCR